MGIKDFEKLVRDVREKKTRVEVVFKLVEDGKRDEARAVMAALAEEAVNAPDEIILKPDRPAIVKRRGRLVVLDEERTVSRGGRAPRGPRRHGKPRKWPAHHGREHHALAVGRSRRRHWRHILSYP